jgi:hypothetical protein
LSVPSSLDDSDLRRAVIDIRRMSHQEAYREGEMVGQVQIRKILQGKVIIRTEGGDKLLVVTYENSRQESIDARRKWIQKRGLSNNYIRKREDHTESSEGTGCAIGIPMTIKFRLCCFVSFTLSSPYYSHIIERNFTWASLLRHPGLSLQSYPVNNPKK